MLQVALTNIRKKMKFYTYILFLFITFPALKTYGQETNKQIIYEQKALDFFVDSILNRIKPFNDLRAHFDGRVDSSITTIEYSMVRKFPDDRELREEYQKSQNATHEFWIKNKKPTFLLQIKKPVKNKSKKHYGHKSNVIRLMVFQNKNVGIRNYVWFRTFIKSGYEGYDLYFILDNEGKVISWTYSTFIF